VSYNLYRYSGTSTIPPSHGPAMDSENKKHQNSENGIKQRKPNAEKDAQNALFPENTVPSDFKLFNLLPTEDLTDNSGELTKKVIRAGKGVKATKGQIVSVFYSGYLTSGLKFDSNKGRSKAFDFQLGKAKVIEGWEIGIASMQEGERAILTCAPKYAYGVEGVSQVIPPNSTLVFDIELVSVRKESHILSSQWRTLIAIIFFTFILLYNYLV